MSRTQLLVCATMAMWMFELTWLISPIDPIPDFIPFFGWLDDALSLFTTVWLTTWTVIELHEIGAQRGLTGPKVAYEPIPIEQVRTL